MDDLGLLRAAFIAGAGEGQRYPNASSELIAAAADAYVKLVLLQHGRRYSLDEVVDSFYREWASRANRESFAAPAPPDPDDIRRVMAHVTGEDFDD